MRANQKDLLEFAHFLAQQPCDEQHTQDELRSGQLWTRHLERWAVPEGLLDFPGLAQFVKITRTVYTKKTRTLKVTTHWAITSLLLEANPLQPLVRLRWGVENRSHHKRDTVLEEDHCRSRKAAASLAALRNLILGLLHQGSTPVLRATRRFRAHPAEAFHLLHPT